MKLADVLLQRMFATHRLADADSLYRTGIDATGKIIINCPHFAKFAGQHLQRLHTQLFPVVNPQSVHLLRRYRSHSPETFNGQPATKSNAWAGCMVQSPSGLR